MEKCDYIAVDTSTERGDSDEAIPRKYLLRQIFVCSGIWASYFCFGLSFGSPTVYIPQIRQEANSSDAVSTEMVSWLSSTFNYSGIVSTPILAVLTKLIGRKFSFLIICVTSIVGYILFYFSATITEILISEIILGPLIASTITVSMMVLTENVSPQYRGVFLTLKSATFLWGVWVANAMGTFLHWKTIGILAFIFSIYSLLTTLLWPESPYWLVVKGRFEDCVVSHRWLKGRSKKSEEELLILMQSRKTIQSLPIKPQNFYRKCIKILSAASFYKPILVSVFVSSLYQFSGKIACGMYAIDIIRRITDSESTAYTGMLVLDGITILGMYFGCGLAKILKRRTLLLVSASLGVTFLFCISLYLYLIHLKILAEYTFISMSLLMGYSLTMSVGPMIMATTILGELIPLKSRTLSVVLLGCYGNLLMGSILKLSPFVINYFDVRGLFLFFSLAESFLIIINYKLLPETKDKTLLEIQEILLGKKSTKNSSNCPEKL